MATTTNYGWTTPDDTALVKDGASAIRTLGSSIDTTTKNLNPETTLGDIAYRSSSSNTNTRLAIGSSGQVLTVAAGVPSWATPTDQTPLTTKGDLFTFSTVDARVGVGANCTVLTADSAEATGLKWAAPAAGGGMTLLSTTTLTGASTTVSSIDQTYNSLYILVRRVNMGTTGTLGIRPNAAATSTHNSYLVNATAARIERGQLVLVPTERTMTNNETFNGWSVMIDDYANTANDITRPFRCSGSFYRSDDSLNSINNAGGYFASGAITSIEIIGTGNFASGTMLIYGVK